MGFAEAVAVFSGIVVLSFGLTTLFSGMFTTYFGAGKSRKIGIGLVLVGLLTLFAWTTVTFGVNIFSTTQGAWTADQMATGVSAVVAGGLGMFVALGLFLIAIMRA